MRVLGATVVAALVTLIAACGGVDDGRDAPGERETSSRGSEPSSELPDAATALRDALRSMSEWELLRFTYRAAVFNHGFATTEGVQRRDGGWSAASRFREPGRASGPFLMDVRAADGQVWMTMRDWPPRLAGCWLAMPPTEVPLGVLAMVPDEIGYISILTDLVAEDWEAGSTDYMDVSLGMAGVSTLLTGQTAQELTLTPAQTEDIRVDALARLRTGRIARIEVEGQDLIEEIDRVGGTLTERARAATKAIRWTVSYDEAPPPSLVMTEEDAAAGCH